MNTKSLHTFVVCAYKESKYLEECIKSLLNQTVESNILISTSTPNEHIENLAKKYNISLYVNDGIKGICADWNFAVSKANTNYITIAHQDDIYNSDYTEIILKEASKKKKSIIIYSDYYEIRDNKKVSDNQLLKIKRIMNFWIRLFPNSKFVRNRILSLGNPICCPAVTYSMNYCKEFEFDVNYTVSCDWEAWSRLATNRGSFVYVKKTLMGHRIHEESETTVRISNNSRQKEDLMIYKRYWPDCIAKLLMKFYSKSQDSNKT